MELSADLSKYKSLCLKNKKALEQLSKDIIRSGVIFGANSPNQRHLRQQYDMVLSTSKEAIEYNNELQD